MKNADPAFCPSDMIIYLGGVINKCYAERDVSFDELNLEEWL